MTEETAEQKLARYEYVLDAQMAEIDNLRGEVQRLTSGADAQTTLQSVYRNPALPESIRVKAAAASLPTEKPRLLSVLAPAEMDRREAWRIYERWALRRQIMMETRNVPPKGWDAHLVGDTYQPPEGDDMPPVRVLKDATGGFRTGSELLPSTSTSRRIGNGNGGDEPSEGSAGRTGED